jgi:acetylglutamate kinase
MTTVVVKIGGKAAEAQDSLASLCEEILALSRGSRFLLVHGGGAEVSAISRKLGVEPVFIDGVRQTSEQEMDIVDMVLAGKINKQMVRLLRTKGLNAVGLSGTDGGIFTGRPLGGGQTGTRTGEVTSVDERLLTLLLDNGFLPVLSSASMDDTGQGLNINADAAAFSIASHLAASALVFLSDIPGILSEGSVIQAVSATEARGLITRGVITGGMIPKVSAALTAMDQGVQKVIIGQYDSAGSLGRLLEGKQGTRLWK